MATRGPSSLISCLAAIFERLAASLLLPISQIIDCGRSDNCLIAEYAYEFLSKVSNDAETILLNNFGASWLAGKNYLLLYFPSVVMAWEEETANPANSALSMPPKPT